MRIHELAKNKNIPTNELLKIFRSLGIQNKKSASVLSKKNIEKYQKFIEENQKDKPEVALIKKKPKEREEEHKKIVIKKKKVVILKKTHKEELKKETIEEKKKGPTKKEVIPTKVATTKTVFAKAERKAPPKDEKSLYTN